MQSRVIARLARKLRSTHRLNKSWRKTAEICHVLTPRAELNPGLARRIAEENYQPSTATIKRLEYDGAIEAKKPRVIRRMISDMTADELTFALMNRIAMPDADPKVMKAFIKACQQKQIIKAVTA